MVEHHKRAQSWQHHLLRHLHAACAGFAAIWSVQQGQRRLHEHVVANFVVCRTQLWVNSECHQPRTRSIDKPRLAACSTLNFACHSIRVQDVSSQNLSIAAAPVDGVHTLTIILSNGVQATGEGVKAEGAEADPEAGTEAGGEAEEKPSMEEPLIKAAKEARERVARLEAIISGPQPVPVGFGYVF